MTGHNSTLLHALVEMEWKWDMFAKTVQFLCDAWIYIWDTRDLGGLQQYLRNWLTSLIIIPRCKINFFMSKHLQTDSILVIYTNICLKTPKEVDIQ